MGVELLPDFRDFGQEFGCAPAGMLLQNNSSQVWPLLWFMILNPVGADFPNFQNSVSRNFRVRKGYQADPTTKIVSSVRL